MAKKKAKRAPRIRNYRIPVEERNRDRYFPTMPVLFAFTRRVVADMFGGKEEDLTDSQVVRFIFPGFPYAHQFKLGIKNISHVGYVSFLARHLGVPLAFIQKIRTGEWDLERAWEEYLKFKKRNRIRLVTEVTGPKGIVEIELESKTEDANRGGKMFGVAIRRLRPLTHAGRQEIF